MGNEQENHEEVSDSKEELSYDLIMNPAIVEEQPFYHKGISALEVAEELAYLNQNMPSFYDGSYMPLWKQKWFR